MLGPLLSPLRTHGTRWYLRRYGRLIVPVRPAAERELDVYWLSTGRCGTHFASNVLERGSSAHVVHDSGMILDDMFRAGEIWSRDPERFWSMRLEEFPWILTKIRENAKYPARVFIELAHSMFPFGVMVHEYITRQTGGTRRAKFVHLVREPAACCRSMLKVEREGLGGQGFRKRSPALVNGEDSASKAASVWNAINTICAQTVERLGPDIARTVQVESLDVAGFESLWSFMELEAFDRDRIQGLLDDRSQTMRHSHLARSEIQTTDASDDELAIVRELTAPLARQLGYDS